MWKFNQIFFLSFFVAALCVPLLRTIAFRFKILDFPKNHGIHIHPVPRLGGVAICIAFVVGAIFRMDLSEQLKGVLLGSSIIFTIGLLDDIFHLRASLKLLIQILACGIMMFNYGVILHMFPWPVLDAFFTALGIIGLTNAVNFLDNMDGLASGLVAISSFTIFLIAFQTHQIWLAYLTMALVGATIGFLVFNLRPAHIFMGDSGSTFLGFTLASFTVMTDWSSFLPVTLAVPILMLGVPILDMILITILRAKEGKVHNFKEWIDYTGKDHLSHRVMRLGVGKRGAVFCLWGLQALFCAVGWLILPQKNLQGILGLAFYFAVVFGVIFFFRKKRSIILRFKGRQPYKKGRNRLRKKADKTLVPA